MSLITAQTRSGAAAISTLMLKSTISNGTLLVDPDEMAAHLKVAAVSLSVALLATAQAQRNNDAAVFGVLQRADPTLFEMRVIHRVEVTAVLDLVIAIGTPRRWELGPAEDFVWWNAERKLGLFLQERSNRRESVHARH